LKKEMYLCIVSYRQKLQPAHEVKIRHGK